VGGRENWFEPVLNICKPFSPLTPIIYLLFLKSAGKIKLFFGRRNNGEENSPTPHSKITPLFTVV